jgi:hypothetical protein
MREQLIREVEIIPLEVVVRNVAAGSLSQRLGIEEGTQLPRSIIEFYYKNDQLGDPMVSEEHVTAFGWATPQEIDDIMALAIRVNDFLSGLFLGVGIRLVDFKMETGRLWENDLMRIVVADELSPDSCRLWDIKSNEKLDKDRFRRDLGGLVAAYSLTDCSPHQRSDIWGVRILLRSRGATQCVSRAQRSTSRAFTPVCAGYDGALQTRDRPSLWRSRISNAPLRWRSRCIASGTRWFRNARRMTCARTSPSD